MHLIKYNGVILDSQKISFIFVLQHVYIDNNWELHKKKGFRFSSIYDALS